jgi:thermolysin
VPATSAAAILRLRRLATIERVELDAAGLPRVVRGRLSPPVAAGGQVAAVQHFLELEPELFGLRPAVDALRVTRVRGDALGMTHLRLRQEHAGVRVASADLRAHFDAAGVLRMLNGRVLAAVRVDTQPRIDGERAIDLAQAAVRPATGQPFQVDRERLTHELVIVRLGAITGDADRLVWRVHVRSTLPHGRWEVDVDAHDGSVVAVRDRLCSHGVPVADGTVARAGSEIGTGFGVMGDTKDHIDTWFDDVRFQLDDRTRQEAHDPHGHAGRMGEGEGILTYQYGAGLPGWIMEDPDNVWDDSNQAAAVDAHVYAAWVYDFLNHGLGRNGFDDAGGSMVSSIDDRSCTNNAYWDGVQVSYCRVTGGNRPMPGSLDIVAHEWGHAVTEYSSDLVYAREPGALNESFSDMLGVRLEHAHGTPNWLIGENFNGSGFRSLANPRIFGDPDCRGGPGWVPVTDCVPSERNDWCGVHTNSGVPNRMFHLLSEGGTANNRTVVGLGIDAAFQIMHRSNVFYWTSEAGFDDAMFGSMAAAQDLDPGGEWAQQVELAWQAVCVGAPANVAPVAVAGGPYAGSAGELVLLDGSGSYDDDGTIVGYNWEFGDGAIGSGVLVGHVYETAGTYTATLWVLDSGGLFGAGTARVEVTPVSAVELAEVQLVPRAGAVTVVWRTAAEADHAGFHVWRRAVDGTGEDGAGEVGGGSGFVRLTRRLLRGGAEAGGGDRGGGRTYEYVDRTVRPGATYAYRLEAVDRAGERQLFEAGSVTTWPEAVAVSAGAPTMHPNRPNPFNPSTTIAFEVPAAGPVSVRIYDGQGRQVRRLAERRFAAGRQEVGWDGRDDAGRPQGSGVYVVRVRSGAGATSRKIVLVR